MHFFFKVRLLYGGYKNRWVGPLLADDSLCGETHMTVATFFFVDQTVNKVKNKRGYIIEHDCVYCDNCIISIYYLQFLNNYYK